MAYVAPPLVMSAIEVRVRTNVAPPAYELTIVNRGATPYPTTGQLFPLGNR